MRLDIHTRREPSLQKSKRKVLLNNRGELDGNGNRRERVKFKDAKTRGTGGGERQAGRHPMARPTPIISELDDRTKLSREQLMKISQQVIEHTKRMGLFDEMRMKLLNRMESRPEFQRVEQHFVRQVDLFCKHEADLTKTRAELRKQLIDRLGASEQLGDKQLHERTTLSISLDKNIDYVVQKYRRDLLRKCNETAKVYLLEQYGPSDERSGKSCTLSQPASQPVGSINQPGPPTPPRSGCSPHEQMEQINLDEIPLPESPVAESRLSNRTKHKRVVMKYATYKSRKECAGGESLEMQHTRASIS